MATPAQTTTSEPLRPALRRLFSILIAVHLLAVFTGPWAMPPQRSILAGTVAQALQPYMQSAFLDNGYRFFAPEPGPSHLVRYELVLKDGGRREGYFPNQRQQWPRLLYHRYFMMSEFLNLLDNPYAPPGLAEAYAKGYARYLARQYDAEKVTLYLRRHYVPRVDEVRKGTKLNDPALFEDRLLGVYQADTL